MDERVSIELIYMLVVLLLCCIALIWTVMRKSGGDVNNHNDSCTNIFSDWWLIFSMMWLYFWNY